MSKTTFKWNGAGVITILNRPQAQAVLDSKAELAKAIALAQWEIVSRHQSSEPIVYARSFGIRSRRNLLNGVRNRQVYNDDPEWYFVEFGVGHGAGKPGYKYRIFGHTLDVLASGGGL